MKKLLRILLIALGVFLILLILTPMLFKSKIENIVKEKVNQQVHATVDWTSFGLSFFRGFPYLSISLHEVSVVGVEPFAGDTLAGLKRFEIRVNPFSAIRKNIEVKSILLDQPLINAIVMEDRTANWDITDEGLSDEDEEDTPDAAESTMTVSLKRFAMNDGRIYFQDKASDIDASMEELNLELSGDFSMDRTEVKLSAGIERINAKKGGIRYLRNADFHMELLAQANLPENRYTLKENLISLNGLALGAEGEVMLLDEGAMELDLKFFSRETSFETLLSLVPAIYLTDFQSLEASGSLQLEGTVSGVMKDSILPDIGLNLQVKDGYFAYPDLPKDVSDVQIALLADYKGSDMDASRVDLKQFHLLLGGNPFDMRLQMEHPVSDMHVAGSAEGSIDFNVLQDIVPLEDMKLEGSLQADLRWDVLMSYMEQGKYEDIDLEGSLMINDLLVENNEVPVPVLLDKMSMVFNPRMVELEALDLKMGSSDLHMNGELENFIPYVFEGQIISGRLNVSSTFLDVNELIPELNESSATEGIVSDTLLPATPDSLAEPLQLRIPENIDFAMALDIKQVSYGKIKIENTRGKIRVMEGVAGLQELGMDAMEGSVNASGWVDTRGDFAEVDLSVDMEHVDIPTAYETFVVVEKLAPMARFVRGHSSIAMEYHSFLDKAFAPLYQSIDARGEAKTTGLQLYKLDEFVPLSEVLNNEKFRQMAPDEVKVRFTISDGRIILDPFDVKVYDSRITVSGSHGIDLTMDYTMDMEIAKSDLGQGANEIMQGMRLLAAGTGVKIPQSEYIKVIANIRGTFNHPRISTDLSGNLQSEKENIQEALEEKITGEIEKVESEVRVEASEKAEQIIANAEREAARLVEEAREAGQALVKEAELQGDKLLEEAGNNPLKQVAARTAAGELKKQAEKRSAGLIKEAETQGATLIQNARDEANKI